MEYKKMATEEAIKDILAKGVKNMPQNPAACGYKPEQIRKFYYKTEELTLELLKMIEDNISKFIVDYVFDAIIEVDTLPEASNKTIGKVYVLKDEIISKEKNLYKYAYTTIKQEDKYVWLKVSDNVLATLLSDGEGKYSIVTQEDDDKKNEAHGRSGISAGRLSKTYQRATFSFGGNNQSGMSEEEFKAYFWDANHLNEDGSRGAPINGGKGLDADGNVLDRDGRKYEESYGYEFTTGQENKNYGKSALVGGEYNINYGLAALLVGKGLFNTGDFSVLLGGREISKDIPWRIVNKGLRNLFFGYFLSSYNTTYEKDFNDCVLLGSGLVPSNDGCVGVGANGGDKHNSEGILRFFVGAGKGFLFDEDGNPIIDPETGKQKFEGFNALEVYEGGRVSIAKKPKLPTEVARLEEINELDIKLNTKIDTLHANGFIVVKSLPTASKDTLGKIYLILQEEGGYKNIFDEYITVYLEDVDIYADGFVWEKIGSTEFKMIVDTELSLDSENPVQNKVITEALNTNLLNIKIVDQDLSLADFVPTPNTYYRHTNRYNTKYDNGTILFYNGTDYEIVEALNSFVSKWESTVGGYGTILVRSPNGKYSNTGLGSGSVTIAGFVPTYTQRTAPDGTKSTVIVTGNPVNDVDATPKKYVDDLVASVGGGSKTYIHNITFQYKTGELDADGFPIYQFDKLTGKSKINTPFTYVQGKGILLGTFSFTDENPAIYEMGIQPEVFEPTSAWTGIQTKCVLLPRMEFEIEDTPDYMGRTIYLTKLEDSDLTQIYNFYDGVKEA